MAEQHARDGQGAGGGRRDTRPLALTLGLVVVYMGLEVAGGLVSGSLALLADAGHMLSDAGALGLTLFAMRLARRPPTAARTFGYHRAEILAALANGVTLVAIAVFIFVEAYERLRQPPDVQGGLMLAVACGGLAVNGAGLWLLRDSRDQSLNARGAWLHVLTDTLGSLQAIGAGLLIWTLDWTWVDPVASMLIGLLVVHSSWSLVEQSVSVLMESTPGHIDVDEVRSALLSLADVVDVQDLHVWTITSGFVACSTHVVVSDRAAHPSVLEAARHVLAQRFGIGHTTIQVDVAPAADRVPHAPSPRG
ncbi:MAG: cation diffusion facilitator family transporter [Vicinamibacterales bacterium]